MIVAVFRVFLPEILPKTIKIYFFDIFVLKNLVVYKI